MAAGLALMLGADVGSTLVVQLLSFDISWAAPALILIHGFPTASWDWHPLWQPLCRRFHCLTLDMIGFGIVIPILPFITPRLGGSTFDIALIIVAYGIAASVVGPFWGRLSDRIGL